MFRDLGTALGYAVRTSYSQSYPTDGVWLARRPLRKIDELPLAAIEIAVSESRKTLRGSILTLEVVSPALGIVLIHEDELRRRHIRLGGTADDATRRVEDICALATTLVATSRQRIEVWSFAALRRRYHEATGVRSLYELPSDLVSTDAP
jgi:hypothetical protein